MTTPRWTIVQHSGVNTGHQEFTTGLEPRRVPYRRDQEAIAKAGGLLFDDYAEADAYAEKEQYPPGSGMVPRAPGTFAKLHVDGLPVYVPPALKHRFVVTVEGCTDEQAEALMRHEFGRGGMPQRRELQVEGSPPVQVEIDWGWESCT